MIRTLPTASSALWLRWVLVIGWMILIFSLSHMNGSDSANGSFFLVEILIWLGIDPAVMPLEMLSFLVRKSAHFTEYLLLAIFALPLFSHYLGKHRAYWLAAWFFCVAYAASDEWHQTFVPGREGKWTDVLIDGAGAALGLWLIKRRRFNDSQE
ncbi:MAG: VanZ family protein [Bacteroidia bacterium]|nr:VanZ family protein [Bacteroidia bacterium]